MSAPSFDSLPAPAAPPRPRLLDQLRQVALSHFGRPEPGQRFVDWARRYIVFHGIRHPRELGFGDVARFLDHLAQTEKDPLRCIEEAREALAFLYQRLLGIDLGELPFPEPPRLLDRLRRALRVRHYSPRTEACYVEWATRFIRFHGIRPQHDGRAGGRAVPHRPGGQRPRRCQHAESGAERPAVSLWTGP